MIICQRLSILSGGGKYRTKLTSKIIRSCGENVNVEKGASFTPELVIGDNSGIGINSEIYGPVFIGNNVLMGPEVIKITATVKRVYSFEIKDMMIIKKLLLKMMFGLADEQ